MSNAASNPGCAPTRGSIIAIIIAILWVTYLGPMVVSKIEGPPPKEPTPEQVAAELQSSAALLMKSELPLPLAALELTVDAEILLKRNPKVKRENIKVRISELEAALKLFDRNDPVQLRTIKYLAEKAVYLKRLQQELDAGIVFASANITKTVVVADATTNNNATITATGASDGGTPPVVSNGTDKPTPEVADLAPKEILVETDTFLLKLNTRGAAITRSELKKFSREVNGKEPLPLTVSIAGDTGSSGSFVLRPVEGSSIEAKLEERVWDLTSDTDKLASGGARTIVFTKRIGLLEFTKTFEIKDGATGISVALSVKNLGKTRINNIYYEIIGPNGLVHDEYPSSQYMYAYLAGRTGTGESVDADSIVLTSISEMPFSERAKSPSILSWAALKNRYFTMIMQIPASETGFQSLFAEEVKLGGEFVSNEFYGAKDTRYAAVGVRLKKFDLTPGEVRNWRLGTYFGELDEKVLAAASTDEDYSTLVDFGIAASISKFLLWILNILYMLTSLLGDTIGGYGLAIILLTLVVKGALHPLQRKSSIAMHKMQKLAPQIKVIQNKYSRDKSMAGRQKMQLELSDLYKRNNASPVGGCLPILIQLPMLLALFGMLRGAFELRHAGFLWIDNLATPDHLFTLPFTLPVIGNKFNLLPLIYVAVSLIQQKFQPEPTDEQQVSQRKMMKYMLIFFAFIFYNMPAALVLYFACSGIIGAVEQWYIREYIIAEPTESKVVSVGEKTIVVEEPSPTTWDKEDEKKRQKADRKNRRGR